MGWRETFDALADYTRLQQGLVTSEQAQIAGVSGDELSQLVASGDVELVCDGVYRFTRDLRPDNQEIWAYWLALNPSVPAYERLRAGVPDAIVSHLSAADLFGIGRFFGDDVITFTTLPSSPLASSSADVRIVERAYTEIDYQLRGGLPVARPERVVADLLIDGVDESLLAKLALDALRLRLVDEQALTETLAAFATDLGAEAGDGAEALRILKADALGEYEA